LDAGAVLMEPTQSFWETVGADGPVPVRDLLGRIDDVLTEYPEFIHLDAK